MRFLLSLSDGIDTMLTRIAQLTGWLFLVAIFVICLDIFSRKLGYQLPYWTSTRLQELQWHLTSTLFLGWLAYGVVKNTHVRIDVFTAALPHRTRHWLDLIGCLVLALPFAWVVTTHAFAYAARSFAQGESSPAPNGLPALFVIKSIAAFGLGLLLVAAVSVICRKIVCLFGPPHLRTLAGDRP